MKLYKDIYGLEPGSNTFICGEFDSINMIKDYLDQISFKLENVLGNNLSNYDRKRINFMKKPFHKDLYQIIRDEKIYENEDEVRIDRYSNIILNQEKYDELFERLNSSLDEKIKEKVFERYNEINDSIKNNYSFKIDEDNIYYKLKTHLNSSSYYLKESYFEDYALPVNLDSNNLKKFYLNPKGNKYLHDQSGSILFKNKSVDGLKDLMKNGTKIKDISLKSSIVPEVTLKSNKYSSIYDYELL